MIFRSAARARRRAHSRSAALPAPAISRRRSKSRARARAYIRYYNLPPQSVNRFIPPPTRRPATIRPPLRASPLTRLRATYVHAPSCPATRPLPADSRHCLRFGFCALARRPRGHSRPRTRHKSRPRRHKNKFSNIAPKSLFARQQQKPARAAIAARLLGAMGREPDLRHGQERRKPPKTTLENSHFYKTSLKSEFFESTILSKSSKSRVVLRGMGGQTARDGRAEAFSFFV